MNPYQKLMARKRKWTPVKPPQACVKKVPRKRSTAPWLFVIWNCRWETLSRCIKNEVPKASVDILRSNVTDEENHDLALGYIAEAYGVDEQAESEAKRLQKAWIEHPDHTVLKAMVAERAIFFVLLPFFRFNGDAGMRTVCGHKPR